MSIERKRKNLEMQGFLGLDDSSVVALEPWLRLSPAICMTIVAIGTFTGSEWIIFALVPFAIGGVVLHSHPFDVLYDFGVRRLTGGPKIPRYGAPRRFACGLASMWLIATGSAFHAGWTITGTLLGGVMATIMSVQVLTGFCSPSWVFRKVTGSFAEKPVGMRFVSNDE